eukprot:gene37288-48753_t
MENTLNDIVNIQSLEDKSFQLSMSEFHVRETICKAVMAMESASAIAEVRVQVEVSPGVPM